ncbi:MAG TPA: CotH kinase family protein, partial [Verrucomicrobiae bacterium]|nr:CotH kinase family protein [Verrucomicrobiae bacterium]
PATATVRQLFQIEVFFNEPVTNVQAGDLLINNTAAESVEYGGPEQFIFTFPQPPTGAVSVAWAGGHGITDLSSSLNAFAGGSWTYTLDPNAEPPGVIISEFMAANDGTLNDEDGDSSDWIELYNAGTISANLSGWHLTDDAADLTKWRIPALTLLPNTYTVIFASGKNKTVPTGTLHTSFQLSAGGEYLALVDDLTNVVSEFAPVYPAQLTDVSYGRDRANPTVVGYFQTPTPRAQNTPGGAGFAPEVDFSRASSTFSSTFNLSLSTTSATAVIRYTLNSSIPTESSTIYTTPLTISATTRVRTRAFEPGLLPGPVRSQHYIRLDSSVLNTSSDLPLMILHNFGGGAVPASGEQFVVMQIFEPKTGRSRLVNAPDLSTRGRFRLRGSSTQGIAKGSFAFEAWDEFNDGADIAPLGMPPESDWVLYAPNQFDPVLMHNSFMYELSNDVGRYAPRTRFVEVYLKDDSGAPGAVVSADYNGVYLLEEKIKRDRNRVDIDNLEPEHVQPPEVTGGYLLKIDRRDPGDGGFSAGGQGELNYVDPKEEEIELPQRDPQQQYINSYINAFGAALNGANYTDPVLGYAPFIDIPSFIDHHLLNVLSENADAFRLSTYLFKPRDGKLEFGPIWDFDRSLESKADNRDDNPSVWHDGGTDFFNYTWWGRL